MAKYHRNYLTSVIARIDFPNHISVQDKLPQKLMERILKSFPISEPTIIAGKSLKAESETEFKLQGTEWKFYSKTRDKSLTLTEGFFAISLNKYESVEELKKDFLEIVQVLFDVFKDQILVNRFGLRYINEIKVNEGEPLNWSSYIDEKLLCHLSFPVEKEKISKGFCTLVVNYGNMIMNFNYGIHNPDFPAPIKNKTFILDYDVYLRDLQEINDIQSNFLIFHEKILETFELSIKDSLRSTMRAV